MQAFATGGRYSDPCRLVYTLYKYHDQSDRTTPPHNLILRVRTAGGHLPSDILNSRGYTRLPYPLNRAIAEAVTGRENMSQRLVLRTLSRCINTPFLARGRLSPRAAPRLCGRVSFSSEVAPGLKRGDDIKSSPAEGPPTEGPPAEVSPAEASPAKTLPFSSVKDPAAYVVEDWQNPRRVVLRHTENKKKSIFLPFQLLRDSCECSQCVDPHSGQKTFGTTEIPEHQSIQSCVRQEDGTLVVTWAADSVSGGQPHESRYPLSTVETWFGGRGAIEVRTMERNRLPMKILWDKDILAQSRLTVEYDDWMSSGDGFHAALAQLHGYGMVIVNNVPRSEDSVDAIANRLGHTMETFYGRTWDVRSKPQAENVAYTSSFLGLHQDMLYLRDPPRIQFLHCLENTCDGGESIFSDAMRAALLLQYRHPGLSGTLQRHLVRYHYAKNGQMYEQYRPVLRDSTSIFWSPPFQAVEQDWHVTNNSTTRRYEQWHAAARKLRQMLEDDHWVYERKLQPGQCVIFDNMRVLHGRRRFDTGSGARWLKGTYVSSDVWRSKRLTMREQIREAGDPATRELAKQVTLLHVAHPKPGVVVTRKVKNKNLYPKKSNKTRRRKD